MDYLGLLFVAAFYVAVLVLGLCASRRILGRRSDDVKEDAAKGEDLLLAGRDLGVVAGVCTLVATEVGGAFLNGTAEEVFRSEGGGLLWCVVPIGYSISMAINGFTFAPKLREKGCVTLIDVLQRAYGSRLGALVYLPSCVGDVCWTAAVLTALGESLESLVGVGRPVAVAASATVAAAYTLAGGLRAVVATDAAQLALVVAGLGTAVPLVLASTDVDLGRASVVDWTGHIPAKSLVTYLDTWAMILLGGIPWQPYYQRALSLRSPAQVRSLSLLAAASSACFVVPPVILGVVAKTTPRLAEELQDSPSAVLPVTVHRETPYLVSMLCLAAISAAVMSSVDSSLLSGASYLTHNVVSPKDEGEWLSALPVRWTFRAATVLLAAMSTVLSISTATVYKLWQLAGDLGYVVVFPQFFGATYCDSWVNSAGSVASIMVGASLRLSLGEPLFGLPPLLTPPKHSDGETDVLPIKTCVMLTSLVVLFLVSRCFQRRKCSSFCATPFPCEMDNVGLSEVAASLASGRGMQKGDCTGGDAHNF